MNLATPIRIARKARFTLAATTLLPMAACLNVVENDNQVNSYGAITIRGNGGTLQPITTIGTAVFFKATNASIPNSADVTNTCAYSTVDTSSSTGRGDMTAGSELSLQSGANQGKLTRSMTYTPGSVSYITASPFTYRVGDSVTVAVPGATDGFPASSITVRLAEPIIPQDVTIPAPGSPMKIAWNQGDATSAIVLSIKYANPTSSSYANEQIVCSLVDDGEEEINPTALNAFLASPVDKRSIRLSRWRTSFNNPASATLLHIVSLVDSAAVLK